MVCISKRCKEHIYKYFVYSTFFRGYFYSIDWMSSGVKWVIQHNPLYIFIYIGRQFLIYGECVDVIYITQIITWVIVVFVIGLFIFKMYENEVVERL